MTGFRGTRGLSRVLQMRRNAAEAAYTSYSIGHSTIVISIAHRMKLGTALFDFITTPAGLLLRRWNWNPLWLWRSVR